LAKLKKAVLSTRHLYVVIVGMVIVIVALLVTLVKTQGRVKASEFVAGPELVKNQCDAVGSPVINVTQKIAQSIDSGEAGNYWAFDDYNRTIKVWKQNDGTFCAVVGYEGKFDAQAGQTSPGNTGVLTGSEDGNFKGGYRAVIGGVLKANPDLPKKGTIGSVNYGCDLAGNCPGAFDWTAKYFNTADVGFTFDYAWWGWEYHNTGKNVWVNSSEGNSGDIL